MSRGFESHTLRVGTPDQQVVSGINHTGCHGFLPPGRRCPPNARVAAWQRTVAKVTVWSYYVTMTDTHNPRQLRTKAVRSSATEYDAKVAPADFDEWFSRLRMPDREARASAYEEGYADGLRREAEGEDGPRFVNPYREGALER